MYFSVYAKKHIQLKFGDLASCTVKVSGKANNIIRFTIADTSFCFMNCNLTGGKTEVDVRKRQVMLEEISAKAFKGERDTQYKTYDVIDGHEVKVIVGSLNFNLDIDGAQARPFVE